MSCANDVGYRITMDSESKSNLTNIKCQNRHPLTRNYYCEFTISELEVWEIIIEK